MYARSAKASAYAGSPAFSACFAISDPGGHSSASPGWNRRIPSTTAVACSGSTAAVLYNAPCGLTYRTREPAARANASSAPIW